MEAQDTPHGTSLGETAVVSLTRITDGPGPETIEVYISTRGDAVHLTQETFVGMFHRLGSFRPEKKFSPSPQSRS